MPIKIPDELPAKNVLLQENVFVMDSEQAFHQDIRPLQILILNIMPTKEQTETQLLRLLGNSPLQVEVTFIHPTTYAPQHTSKQHMTQFYQSFDDIRKRKFDGMIITGAPIEHLAFEEVIYWKELERILEWRLTHVTSTLHICWGAQAALYYHFGIPKHPLDQKMFGVFSHAVCVKNDYLHRGFDDVFYVPHSRHTEIRREDIEKFPGLQILSESEEAGIFSAATHDRRQIFLTGHCEYDLFTLKDEYQRDTQRHADFAIPKHYFPNDDPAQRPIHTWRSHAHLLFSNWLNYYVYQETPYELETK